MSGIPPCDWDQESYCVEEGCHNPATHSRLDAMADDLPMYELVCCRHSVDARLTTVHEDAR